MAKFETGGPRLRRYWTQVLVLTHEIAERGDRWDTGSREQEATFQRALKETKAWPFFEQAFEQKTLNSELDVRLALIWSDLTFWQKVRGGRVEPLPNDTVEAYLLYKYLLLIPWNKTLWDQMVARPNRRNLLFFLMCSIAEEFMWVQSADPEEELEEHASEALQRIAESGLLLRYANSPGADFRPWLFSQGPPTEVLERLRDAGKRLASDAAWCLRQIRTKSGMEWDLDRQAAHLVNQMPPRRPQSLARRSQSLALARTREDMVDLLRGDPTLPDYQLSKRCLGRDTAAGRKQGQEAKLLAYYRDRLPVIFYNRRGQGRRSP